MHLPTVRTDSRISPSDLAAGIGRHSPSGALSGDHTQRVVG